MPKLKLKPTPKLRCILRAAPRWGFRCFVFFVGFELLQILVYKYVPVPLTNTMLLRKVQCLLQAQAAESDCSIYYEWVPYGQVSDYAKLGVIAMEDGAFAFHRGVDWAATRRALQESRGGSTITQQVAKNVLLWQGGRYSRYVRKLLELPLAYLLEWFWGKRRILEVYLNVAELGPRTFGVQMASQRYFGHTARGLSLWEAGLLAGALPNPRYYLVARPSQRLRWRQSLAVKRIRALRAADYLQRIR